MLKIKLRRYRCPRCKKVVERKSDKQWIKSICKDFGITTRLILVKNNVS